MVELQPTDPALSAEQNISDDDAKCQEAAQPAKTDGAAEAPQDPRTAPPGADSSSNLLRAIIHGIEAVARAQSEQAGALERVEKAVGVQESLPKMLTETKQVLEQKSSVSRAMFEALHAELKSYKDGFLLESVLRPVIRDLISLYDDISDIHRQLMLTLSNHEKRGDLAGGSLILFENVLAPAGQLEHNCDAILEVLERLDVTLVPSNTGKLDKRTQRAVNLEAAENPDQDQQVVRVIRRGFQWRDRMIRPEEVVIKKWKEAFPAAAGNAQDQPLPVKKSA